MSKRSFIALAAIVGGLILGAIGFGVFSLSRGVDPDPIIEAAPVTSTSSSMVTTTTSSTTTSTSTTTTTTLPPKERVVIQGTGDVNLDPNYISALRANGYDYAWEGVRDLFLADDVTVVNLECSPSDLGSPQPKEFVFRCPTESLPSLVTAGVEVANMANNHGADYGIEALVDGRAQLLAAGVLPVGAGADAAEAAAPALIEVGGWTVAVVGFGGVIPNSGWIATDEQAGMRDGDTIETMVEAVAAADAIADIVVVTIHWGVELDTLPRADDIERARAMIAAGADVIYGHHPHRLQPLEIIDGAAVFWSLGNFVWPNFSFAGSTTGVGRVVIEADGSLSACLIPAFIENPGQPVLTGEPECGT